MTNDFANAEAVARRYAHRPGCRFVKAEEVGIAVYLMDLRVILMQPSEIGPVDEFLLRAIRLEVCEPPELARFLGLDQRTVESRLVELRRSELIEIEPTDGAVVRCRLTAKGVSAAGSLERADLAEVTIPGIAYHGFLRKPMLIDDRSLLRPQELQREGLRGIPAVPARYPRPEEIKLDLLSEVVRRYWARKKKGKAPKLVSVRSVLRNVRTLYEKAVILQYEDLSRGKQTQLAFAVGGSLQEEYEKAFAACKGIDRIPGLIDKEHKSIGELALALNPAKLNRLGPLKGVDGLQEQIEAKEGVVSEKEAAFEAEDRPDTKQRLRTELEQERREKSALEDRLKARKIRRLQTIDCRNLLLDTLKSVKDRLLIVSAFLSDKVINGTFLSALNAALARGVRVWIVYGMDSDGRGEREQQADWLRAEQALGILQQQHPASFQLKGRGNTHEKILLKDNEFVVTGSFNWLSFRGDLGRHVRYEDALYVNDGKVIDDYYQEISGRFAKK